MIVGRLSDGHITIVDRLREPVRFASGLDADRNLTPAAMDRALGCLERFGQRVRQLPQGRVRAVGTNTLRQARNGRAFMLRAQQALGHPVEIISGHEEARLIYLGVAQTAPGEGGRRLVMDIGGGSTELIVGQGFDILASDSLYMGCVSYSLRFFPDDKFGPKRFRDAQLAAELELQTIAQPYRKLGWQTALGCSGTAHAVAEVLAANGWSEQGLTLKGVKKLRKELCELGSVEALERLPGLTADRRPVIAGGAAIIEAVFETLHVESMQPSPGALREGVLYDLIGRIRHEDVRERTIRALQHRYQVDTEQAERVEQAALKLLVQAAEAWSLSEADDGQFLAWAARLHEIGIAISHTGYHKHGAYLVANSDMAGFARDEQLALAALIGSHRRKLKRQLFEGVDPGRFDTVTRLSVLLRLAVCLDRSRETEALPVVVRAKKKSLLLAFPDGWLEQHPLTLAALEEERAFLAAFGFELELRSAPAP
jgi:exopolyphosphatase/guanosine-5'-triphosphate,3'-diphosphate pyrophosphatase